MMNTKPLTDLIALTSHDFACEHICDLIADSANSDDLYIPNDLDPIIRNLLRDIYPLLTLDDDNLAAIAAAFQGDDFNHPDHIRDTMIRNS
jgi:hypothetical protein